MYNYVEFIYKYRYNISCENDKSKVDKKMKRIKNNSLVKTKFVADWIKIDIVWDSQFN